MENESSATEVMPDGRKLNVTHRAPLAAALVLLLMSVFHSSFVISAMSGVAANLIPTGLQVIFFGFWIGAGRAPLWLRLCVMSLLGLYLPWVIDPMGTRFDKHMFWSTAQVLEPLACLLWGSALFSYLVPRCFLWRQQPTRIPQFKISNLLVLTALVGLCVTCWQSPVELILQNGSRIHERVAIGMLPMGLVVACVGGILRFQQPNLRKRSRNYAILLVLMLPVMYIAAAAVFGREFLDMVMLPLFVAFAAGFMIYPVNFAFWSFRVKWLQILDEPEAPQEEPST